MLTKFFHIIIARRRYMFLLGLLLGALIILVIRFVTYAAPHATHYHANFAVYINGQREEFARPQYYQEVAACSAHGAIQPAQRAHMHDDVNSVLHVHDDGVTWSQFFDNLGWSLGPNFIQTADKQMYIANDSDKLNLVLNGQNLTDLTSIANQTIQNRDRLLISYGDIDSSTLDTEYKSVAATAEKYNETPDPASCSGQMEHVTIGDRFRNLF